MRRRRWGIRLAVTAGFLVAVPLALAQEMKIRQMRMLPDGQMIWSAGTTISKAGVSIPFDSHLIEKKFAGYKLESAAAETLTQGDVVLLYFPGLKVIGDSPKSRRDATGAKVFADSQGAWRAVTIESVTRAGDRVTISFNDELTLDNQQKIRRLELAVVDRFLLPGMAVASGTKAEAARTPVAVPKAPVRVAAEAVLRGGQVVGYKYTESLAEAQPGNRIPMFVPGIEDGSPAGTLKQLTVRQIQRTGAHLRISFEEELILVSGKKLEGMNFVLRQGYWHPTSTPAVTKKP